MVSLLVSASAVFASSAGSADRRGRVIEQSEKRERDPGESKSYGVYIGPNKMELGIYRS